MSKTIALHDVQPAVWTGSNSLWRFLRGTPLAILITVCLLYAMQQLIHMDAPPIVDIKVEKIPPVTMEIPETIEIREDEPPVRPAVVETPPKILTIPPVDFPIDQGMPGIGGPIATEKLPMNGLGGVGQMIPFIKVPPQYPQSALSRGIEGYVDVMFDVTELGTTDNIRIIAFEPSSVFNNAVLKAIKNWKYKPNVVDGVPIRTPDVRDRVRFNMDKSASN